MTGTVIAVQATDNGAVAITVQPHTNETDRPLTFVEPLDKARRFPVGAEVELKLRPVPRKRKAEGQEE